MNLWQRINKETMSKKIDLNNFRSSEVNYRIALPDPAKNGKTYLKQLLFDACRRLTTDQWSILKATRNRNIGNPTTVRFNGEDVDLDYLQAALEFDFVYGRPNLNTIVEIGAGYGRTAHTFLSNSICHLYAIVDLPECLELARRYLNRVLTPEQADKLLFVPASKLSVLEGQAFDLAINIDSFAEMPALDVRRYLRFISKNCMAFYVKNPVGKYHDPTTNNRPHLAKTAKKMGLLTKVIDIYDEKAISGRIPAFLKAYEPRGFKNIYSCSAKPWSYYYQAIFRRMDNETDS